MCLLARAKRQQNLRRTGSVGRKVSKPHASKSKRQQNKRSRYNRTAGKLMRYRVKSNPILWWVEAFWAQKVRSNLQQSVFGASLSSPVAVGLGLAPGCLAALPRGCAASVSSCFPLAAAAPLPPGPGSPRGLCGKHRSFPRWCGLRVCLPDAVLELSLFSLKCWV